VQQSNQLRGTRHFISATVAAGQPKICKNAND